MDNFFVNQLFGWGWRQDGRWLRLGNSLLKKLGVSWIIRRAATPFSHTTTIEQRINLWHLVNQPLAYGVPGDLVELGCFDGKTSVIFARALEQSDATGRQLHLYDHFQVSFHLTGRDVEQEAISNLQAAGHTAPIIHKGDFLETIPALLPEKIAFAHFDCGFGDDPQRHRAMLLHLLEHAYPRMSPGAVGVLMDYFDPALCQGRNYNPGVALAAAEFFAGKPERVDSLWGGEYPHGYFRKKAEGVSPS